mmetsp:Transcript_58940/g.140703  ORF Transcript_58940/g.140703 Transcript_58940/m.140703 type:complete len:541 (+) Transcript_58940:93-1715(+)
MAPAQLRSITRITLLCSGVAVVCGQAVRGSIISSIATALEDKVFKDFIAKYGHTFKDAEDKIRHENYFVEHKRFLEVFNNETTHKCTLRLTELADLNQTEFEQTHLGLNSETPARRLNSNGEFEQPEHERRLTAVPASFDWEQAGAVTAVKNQASCGCCYAFATIAALEGAWQIATGQLIDMSDQQVLDCTYQVGIPANMGCNGGYLSTSLQYMTGANTCTMASYPYSPATGAVGNCLADTCSSIVPHPYVTGWNWVLPINDMDTMMRALVQQPIAVGMAASSTAFMLYGSGIITAAECGTTIDHAVLLVGYGTDGADDYWRLKNQWGTTWGESGYFRVEKDSGTTGGACSILSQPAYPVLSVPATTTTTTAATTTAATPGAKVITTSANSGQEIFVSTTAGAVTTAAATAATTAATVATTAAATEPDDSGDEDESGGGGGGGGDGGNNVGVIVGAVVGGVAGVAVLAACAGLIAAYFAGCFDSVASSVGSQSTRGWGSIVAPESDSEDAERPVEASSYHSLPPQFGGNSAAAPLTTNME